jgi:acid phosphatase (class A)
MLKQMKFINSKNRFFRFGFPNLLATILFCGAVAIAPLRADEPMAQAGQSVQPGTSHYLAAGTLDAIALLAPPPLPASAEQAADLAEVRAVHESCPSNDFAVALSEDRGVSIFYFTPAIGDFFTPGKLPVTEVFLHRVHEDAQEVVNNAKNYWKRPRPYTVEPGLAPRKWGKSFSYPSGHSTESMTLALVLADLFPDKRDAIVAEARAIGWHRVEIARHYPTDIYAGRVLAQAIVREMKKNRGFQEDFAEAKAEIAAAQK